jgi:hypothetical protein
MASGFWQSGPGEMVGVLLAPPATAGPNPSPAARRLVTLFGADPLAGEPDSGPTPAIVPTLPPSPRSKRARQRVAEYRASLPTPVELPLPEEAGRVARILPYAPRRADDGRWYVDLEVDGGSYYYPFVKLSLVRFQPSSVAGAELSVPTLLDFIQVPSGRVVTKHGIGSKVWFGVKGTSRTDTKLAASVLVPADDVLDYGADPKRGELVLDEAGLWQPHAATMEATDKPQQPPFALHWDARHGEFRTPVFRVPDETSPAMPARRWRVLIEETESYLDVDEKPVTRVVWFATYDSDVGFGNDAPVVRSE